MLDESGLKPCGFIAPAWLLNTGGRTRGARCRHGIHDTIANRTDLRSGEHFSGRNRYSQRAQFMASQAASLAWNGTLSRPRGMPLVRLSIHPPDNALYSRIWRQIEGFIRKLAEVRTPTTYRDWIGVNKG